MLQSKLCLGTAQFGLEYGINNRTGKLEKHQVFEVLDTAIERGITFFDTASAYGDAEEILGEYIRRKKLEDKIKVISKLKSQDKSVIDKKECRIREEVQKSIKRLNLDSLKGYLFHDTKDYYDEDNLSAVIKLKQEGLIENIGVSIYDFNEAIDIAEQEIIDYIQIPYSVFDQRAETTGFFQLAKKKKITVFVRSAFLQGLLLMKEEEVPFYIIEAKPYIKRWEAICQKHCIDNLSLALLFCYLNENIDFIVFGVDTKKQLVKNVEIIKDEVLLEKAKKAITEIQKEFLNVDEKIILPFKWVK